MQEQGQLAGRPKEAKRTSTERRGEFHMGRSRREKEQQDHDVEAGEEGADRENRGEDQEATLKTLPEPREETGAVSERRS
jgi:hypothetical protein